MKPWLKTTILLLIGFLLGIAAAGLAVPRFFHPHQHSGLADANRILKKLSSKLVLNDGQKEKVALLLKQELPKRDALCKEGDTKFDALRASFNAQLRTILNPDQQKKLDDMVAQWEKREKKEDHSFGLGSGPVSAAAAVTGN
ncbi:MAG TPA: hypothetical protein VIJ93_13190 [bacterium]